MKKKVSHVSKQKFPKRKVEDNARDDESKVETLAPAELQSPSENCEAPDVSEAISSEAAEQAVSEAVDSVVSDPCQPFESETADPVVLNEALPVEQSAELLAIESTEQDRAEVDRARSESPDATSSTAVQLELVEGEAGGVGESSDQSLSRENLKSIIESLIFVSDKPVTPVQLAKIVRRRQPEVKSILSELAEDYKKRGIELAEIGGGYAFRSAPVSSAYVREFLSSKPVKLTRAQLETLAIAAYRQPVTRPEIEDVRGVDTGSAVKVLLERGLIKMLGRKDEPGRPLLYGTSPFFLEFFGLKSLSDLPTLREFSDLTEESRDLFKRKTGESLEGPADAFSSPSDSGDAEEYAGDFELEGTEIESDHVRDDEESAAAPVEENHGLREEEAVESDRAEGVRTDRDSSSEYEGGNEPPQDENEFEMESGNLTNNAGALDELDNGTSDGGQYLARGSDDDAEHFDRDASDDSSALTSEKSGQDI
jgi:segregation and condensation protein B